mgnify:CR=1 FL=1
MSNNLFSDLKKPIMALLPGGGYAEYAAVNKLHVMPVPSNISVEDVIIFMKAAAIPEVWITAYQILVQISKI